jgi:hypothetical protein
MTAVKYRIALAGLSAIALILMFLLKQTQDRLHEHEIRPSYSERHANIVNRSYEETARADEVPVEQARRMVHPLVVEFPDRDCVQLTPTLETLGGRTTYCFSKDGTRIVERHQIGE